MSIRIITDSNCDLPQELVEKYRITVIPLYINIGSASYLDGVELSRQAFYEGLESFDSHPYTSVPGPGRIIEVFDSLMAEGATQIIAIHVASSLSGMINTVKIAAEQWAKIPVTVFDSGNLSLATGVQALAAAKAAAAGQTLSEIVKTLADYSKRTFCFAALDTVKYLRRSGRLTRFQFNLAALLRIKPVLRMNAGEFDMDRVRTTRLALTRVVDLVTELGPLEHLSLVHTHALERANLFWGEVKSVFADTNLDIITEVTPVIGTHIGPGAIGFVAVKV